MCVFVCVCVCVYLCVCVCKVARGRCIGAGIGWRCRHTLFRTDQMDKQCKLRSAGSLEFGLVRIYTVAIPSVLYCTLKAWTTVFTL